MVGMLTWITWWGSIPWCDEGSGTGPYSFFFLANYSFRKKDTLSESYSNQRYGPSGMDPLMNEWMNEWREIIMWIKFILLRLITSYLLKREILLLAIRGMGNRHQYIQEGTTLAPSPNIFILSSFLYTSLFLST